MKRKNVKTEKRKNLKTVFWFFGFLVLWFFGSNCYAKPISSTELIEKAKEYNNQVVEFEGEVVGDVMARGDFAWVNVNDGQNAIGIWGQKDQIQEIVNRKGFYKCKGDIIRVKGEFHRACAQHGGDLDIHMTKGLRIKDGFSIPHQPSSTKMKWAFSLSLVALGLAALAALKSRKK